MDKKATLYLNVSSQQASDPATKIVFSSQDVGTATIECQLVRNGLPWTIPPQSVGIIQLNMADGTKFTDNTDSLLRQEGIATYTLSSVQLKHVGKVEAELYIVRGSERLSASKFSFLIEGSDLGGGVIGNGVPDLDFTIDKKGNLILSHSEKDTVNFYIDENGGLVVKTWS